MKVLDLFSGIGGFSVVPQVVEQIGRAIMQIEESECDLSR